MGILRNLRVHKTIYSDGKTEFKVNTPFREFDRKTTPERDSNEYK